MKIAILGTRGIPNHYGGFEQVTEYLSVGLLQKGHEITVYNSHNHPHKENEWNGVEIVHCYDPEYLIGTAGQFIYDLNCIRHARKRNYDILLFMGYNSSSIWNLFFPRRKVIVSNMDGLEWMRAKYSKPVQKFLRYAEKLAVRHSHFHIVDSSEIQDYYKNKYKIQCEYIPYGASLIRKENNSVLDSYDLIAGNYFMLMARMEPENNIEMILEGFTKSVADKKFIVVGNIRNHHGKQLYQKYSQDKRLIFTGSLFDQDVVHTLRKYALVYFHGHSVGGTNPSLLEAMASKALIAAHNNSFNRVILGESAFYFTSCNEVKQLIEKPGIEKRSSWTESNFQKISERFYWPKIIDLYNDFLCHCFNKMKEKPVQEPEYVYE